MLNSATVVITTRNRREDACRAVESALMQQYSPLEVIVYDDASTDDTADQLRRSYPEIHVIRNRQRVGLIVNRTRGFRDASGRVIFSIDDDAYFACAHTVGRTMQLLNEFPDAAGVAMPYVEPSTETGTRTAGSLQERRPVRGFIGCAHALRRDAVRQVGGYRDFFVHQGEERDLAIRLLDAGYEFIFGDTVPIVHDCSPRRDKPRMSYYGVRNTLLFDILNIPWPYIWPRLAADAFNLFRHRLTMRTLPERLWYLVCGSGACVKYWPLRRPVRRETYRLYRFLPAHGPLPMSAVGNELLSPVNAGAVFARKSG